MVSSRNTLASLAQADIAPPLAPRVGDIDQTDQTDYVDHVEHVEFLGLPFCMWTHPAATIEALNELKLARQRDPTKWIAKVGDFDADAQFAQGLAIAPALLIHSARIDRIDADVR